jgi:trimeric autotransporter adhesin
MTTLSLTATDPFINSGRGGPGSSVVVGIEGTNDLAVGSTAAQAYANMQSYCAARRAAGWKVIITTVLPRSAALAVSQGAFNAARATYNANLQANWATFCDGLADWASDPTMGPDGAESNTTYYSDGVHPTSLGMSIIAPYVVTAIKSLGYA